MSEDLVVRIAEKWTGRLMTGCVEESHIRFNEGVVESAIREAIEECAKKLDAAAADLEVADLKFAARLIREAAREEAERG